MMELGLLLPHFGEHASGEKILEGSALAERLGFDSVWVRDHLLFEPHGEFEHADATFYDALTVLSVVGARTTRIKLGTGALIPFRHPLHTSLIAATMTQLVGPRLILGFGAGNFDHEFESVGLGGVPRPELVTTNMEVLRRTWTGQPTHWDDGVFRFHDATIATLPAGGDVPLWYCGNTPKSARIAAQLCEGWMPGRIGIDTLRLRIAALEKESATAGRPRPAVGMIPMTSVAGTRERALSRVDVPGLLQWANNARFWVKPPSGGFTGVDDLRGVLLYGTPDQLTEQLLELQEAGVNHVVFDFRLSFGEWEDQIQLLGEDVLPKLKAGG